MDFEACRRRFDHLRRRTNQLELRAQLDRHVAHGRPIRGGGRPERGIEQGKAVERDLRPEDLEGGFLIGNIVRGLIPATLA